MYDQNRFSCERVGQLIARIKKPARFDLLSVITDRYDGKIGLCSMTHGKQSKCQKNHAVNSSGAQQQKRNFEITV